LLPAEQPSDTLWKRNKSLSHHFLLLLQQPHIMEEALRNGGEEWNSSSRPPLNRNRDRVALVLLNEVAEAVVADGLPLSDDASIA
jgi:hypothetical protein